MASLTDALQQLRAERRESQSHVEKLDRVAKWFRNIPERKPTEASTVSSFTSENGGRTEGEVGSGSKGT
jgi:hypothetical protein